MSTTYVAWMEASPISETRMDEHDFVFLMMVGYVGWFFASRWYQRVDMLNLSSVDFRRYYI